MPEEICTHADDPINVGIGKMNQKKKNKQEVLGMSEAKRTPQLTYVIQGAKSHPVQVSLCKRYEPGYQLNYSMETPFHEAWSGTGHYKSKIKPSKGVQCNESANIIGKVLTFAVSIAQSKEACLSL